MSIQGLMSVIPPPQQVLDPGNHESWLAFQKDLGISLPSELFDLATNYGTGSFAQGILTVYNPFSATYRGDFGSLLRWLSEWRKSAERFPYGIFPERPGLFPLARDDGGGALFWLTEGDPEVWPIVFSYECEVWERWEMPLTTFLAKAFSNDISVFSWESFEDNFRVFAARR